MFATRLTQSTARRTYATVPAGQSSSRLPIAVLAAALLGGAYYYSANGQLPEPKDVKAAEEKAASALKGAGASMSALPTALDPKEFKNFKLTRIEPYNHNSSTFHFELPAGHVSGLSVASCVVTKAADGSLVDDKNKPVIRPYTPTSAPDQEGSIEFIVKKYEAGKMSKHFHDLKVGDELAIKGPMKKFEYKANQFDSIGLIMGGSGLTPGWQILQEIDRNSKDKTKATLIYSNVTDKDILIKEKLDDLQKRKPDQFKIVYTLDKPGKGWKGPSGFVTADLLGKNLPPSGLADSTHIFVCGPPGQVAAVAGPKDGMKQGPLKGLLADLGYVESQVYKF